MLIGEQPGSSEDLGAAPFVRPAGRLLARVTSATVHPARVLRAPDPDRRAAARAELFADLALVGEAHRGLGAR